MVLTKFCAVLLILIETLLILLILCSLSYVNKNIKMSVGILTWVSRAFIPFPGASFKMMTGTGFLLIVNFNTWFLISGNFIYPLPRFFDRMSTTGCQVSLIKSDSRTLQVYCNFFVTFSMKSFKNTVVRLWVVLGSVGFCIFVLK